VDGPSEGFACWDLRVGQLARADAFDGIEELADLGLSHLAVEEHRGLRDQPSKAVTHGLFGDAMFGRIA